MSCRDAGGRCGGAVIVAAAHSAGASAARYITRGTLSQCRVTWENKDGNINLVGKDNDRKVSLFSIHISILETVFWLFFSLIEEFTTLISESKRGCKQPFLMVQ